MKKSLKSLLMLLMALVFLAPMASFAQNYHTNSKKAIKYFKTAKKMYGKKKYPKTYKYLAKALDVDGKFTDALLLQAELSLKLEDDDLAIESYEKMFAADSMAFPKSAITLSNLYLKHFRFADAVTILQWYVTAPKQRAAMTNQAKDLLEIAKFRDMAFNNPINYNPENLGPNVNTEGDEYINQILPDGSHIYFTRRGEVIDKHGSREEFIYSSAIIDGEYMPALPMNFDWHNNKRMGAVSISANQNTLYFVGIDFLDSYGRGDIYMSEYGAEGWSKPKNLGFKINTSMMESQPCISADGEELYFVRDSKNYKSDVYFSQLYKGEWSNPKPITTINSKGSEMSPFIHPDGNTLYFASDGRPGMGGYDIFMCKKVSKKEWGTPVNLGYSINSEKDEISFVVSTDGKKGYISSNRDGGLGGFDIYVFDLESIDAPDSVDMKRFVMRNINFGFDDAVLTEESYEDIDYLVSFLKENPSLRIEISGHTDNTGNDEHNMELSLKRAAAVMTALLERGISVKRLEVAGYGAKRPLVPNNTEENKALNRRVEVKVVK